MKRFFILSLLVSAQAFAGIELGTYLGKTDQGLDCSLHLKKLYFRDGIKSPFNEILEAEVDASEVQFDLRHKALGE